MQSMEAIPTLGAKRALGLKVILALLAIPQVCKWGTYVQKVLNLESMQQCTPYLDQIL